MVSTNTSLATTTTFVLRPKSFFTFAIFKSIHIESDDVYETVKSASTDGPDGARIVKDPDGHAFFIHRGKTELPVRRVTTNVKSLADSKKFWSSDVGMNVVSETSDAVVLSYGGAEQVGFQLKRLFTHKKSINILGDS